MNLKDYVLSLDDALDTDIYEVACVVRNLVRSDRVKKLSTGEKKLLGNAKQHMNFSD